MMKSKKILVSIISILLIATSLFAGCGNPPQPPVESEVTAALEATPVPTRELAQATPTMNPGDAISGFNVEIQQDIINILLIGNDSDSPEGDGFGRNDTTMVLQINRKDNTMKLISFMRDMVFNISGVGETSLNNAFYYGGAPKVKKLMKDEFGISIDYYASVSFNAFSAIMDVIGIVSIDPAENVIPDLAGAKSTKTSEMTPTNSLAYVRDRHNPIVDPESGYTLQSDEARNYRQRVFISTVWESVKTYPTFAVPVGVLGAITYVDTDMDEATIITLITEMMDAGATIETLGLPARNSGTKPYYSLYEDLNTEEIVSKSEIEQYYNSAPDKDAYASYEDWKDAHYKVSHIIGWNTTRTKNAVDAFLITD